MAKLSIIIINLNGLGDIKRCIDSLYKQTYQDFEIIFFDNASTDASVEYVSKHYRAVKLVANNENIGFAPALNRSLEMSDSEYCMSLNADIYLTPEYLEEMIRVLESEPLIGSVAGKMYRMTDEGELTENLDAVGHFIKKDRKVIGRKLDASNKDDEQNSTPQYVFGTPACSSIYKRAMLEDIKVSGECFDNDFFAFFEDVDVDWRSQLRGWRCKYTPEAIGYHERGGTGVRKNNPRIEGLLLRNGYLTILKNDGFFSVIKYGREIFNRIYSENLRGCEANVRIPFYTLLLFFKDLVKMTIKRVKVQGRRKLLPEMVENWLQ